jgi:hypothetical protein
VLAAFVGFIVMCLCAPVSLFCGGLRWPRMPKLCDRDAYVRAPESSLCRQELFRVWSRARG